MSHRFCPRHNYARKGNTIEIDGVIDHKIDDPYDFNVKDKEFTYFRKMAETGTAKPFPRHGSKLEKLKGIIDIRNGKITAHKFQWNPIVEEDLR